MASNYTNNLNLEKPADSDTDWGEGALNNNFDILDAQVLKNNYSASLDPTINDDSGDKYSVGSIWINTSTSKVFICFDNTLGAAIWKRLVFEILDDTTPQLGGNLDVSGVDIITSSGNDVTIDPDTTGRVVIKASILLGDGTATSDKYLYANTSLIGNLAAIRYNITTSIWEYSNNGIDYYAIGSGTGGSYTDEEAQDAVGGILVDGSTIDFSYSDETPSISAEVKDLSIDNGKISASAAIVESKLAFDNSAGHDHDGSDSKAVSYNNLTDKPTIMTPESHGNEAHSSVFITSSGVTKETLDANGDIETTITDTDDKIPTSGAIVDYVTGLGGGDMLKATYDSDEDGIVDKAELLDDGATGKSYSDISGEIDSDISTHAGIATAHHSNANDPTSDQKDALTGTSGTPSSTNKFVTNDDSRMSDSRTPSSHGNEAHSSTFIEATDVTFENLNTNGDIGSSAGTVCAGDDSRLSDSRTPTSHGNEVHSSAFITSSGITKEALDSNGDIETTITDTDDKIPTSGAIVDYVSGLGGGDMLKTTYDTDDDGIVDKAEKLDDGATGKSYSDISGEIDTDISNHAALTTAHHTNVNDPSSDEKAALAGTSGVPSSTNKFVTNDDSRMTDSRTPSSHGNEAHSSAFIVAGDVTYENLSANGDIGTGSSQVSQGDHNHALANLSEKSYNNLDDKPSIPTVSDLAYDETSWNDNTDAASKNAIRDKIESLSTEISGKIGASGVTYENLSSNGDIGTGSSQVSQGDHSHDDLHTHTNKATLDLVTAAFTTDDETKLDGIETGAEVNNISDLNATNLVNHLSDVDNPHSVDATDVGLENVTNDAQLKRSANDISTFSEKVTPASADKILIEDSEASGVKKYVQIGNLPTGGSGEANTSSNLGTTEDGEGLAATKVGINLPFKRIKGGTGIDLTSETNDVLIDIGDHDHSGTGYGGQISYDDLTDKPTIPTVDDTEYNATSWDANSDAPTKNAVRDKIELIETEIGGKIASTDVTFENLNTNGDVGTGSAQVAAGDHTHSDLHSHTNKTTLDNVTAAYTSEEATKLSGIEEGAEVNNVSDENATSLVSHLSDVDNPHSVDAADVGLGNVTNDSQLKRAAGDINTFVEKTTPVDADLVVIEDSADSYNKKKVQLSNLPGSGSGETNTASNLGDSGDGEGLFTTKDGVNLPFKRIKAGTAIDLTSETNDVLIDVDLGTGSTQAAAGDHNHNLADLTEKSYNNLDDKPTIPTVDDTAYNETSWDTNTDAATKNAIRDKFVTVDSAISGKIGASDVTYENLNSNGDVGTGSDQVAVGNHNHNLADLSEKSYNNLTDKPTIPVASDVAYDQTTWDSNTDVPTKNAVRDKIELIETEISSKIGSSGVTYENLNSNSDVGTGSDQVAAGDHSHSHTTLSDIGTNSHSQIDIHIGSTDNPHSVDADDVGLGSVTNDAQLKRAAADLNSFSEKATPVSADILIIEDSADGYIKKKIQVSSLPTAGGGEVNTASNLGTSGDGEGLFTTKAGYDLPFKRIKAGKHISLTSETNDILINSSILHKLDGTTAPTTGDDSADGYVTGSIWVDVTNDKAYICLDNTESSAVWTEITGGGSSGGSGNLILHGSSGRADPTNPDAGFTYVNLGTNDVALEGINFVALATARYHQWFVAMPDDWDGSTVTFEVYYTTINTSPSGNVSLKLCGQSMSNDDSLDGSWGTEIEVVDTLIAQNDLHISPTSSALTIANSPSAGDWVVFRLNRDGSDSSDTSSNDIVVLAVMISYGRS